MKVSQRRWCDSRRPFGKVGVRKLPLVAVNWRGYVLVRSADAMLAAREKK